MVEAADVVLEVLDARDPLAYRCTEVEQFIRSADPNKKIVLLLNKIGEWVLWAQVIFCTSLSNVENRHTCCLTCWSRSVRARAAVTSEHSSALASDPSGFCPFCQIWYRGRWQSGG